jgi:hypothetical protein
MSLQVHRVTNQHRAARLSAANSTAANLYRTPDPRVTRRGFIGRANRLAHNNPATYELPFYFPPNVVTEVVLPVMTPGVGHQFAYDAVGAWLENYQGTVKQVSPKLVIVSQMLTL